MRNASMTCAMHVCMCAMHMCTFAIHLHTRCVSARAVCLCAQRQCMCARAKCISRRVQCACVRAHCCVYVRIACPHAKCMCAHVQFMCEAHIACVHVCVQTGCVSPPHLPPLHHTRVPLELQQFLYNLKKIFLRRLFPMLCATLPTLFCQSDGPPMGGGVLAQGLGI